MHTGLRVHTCVHTPVHTRTHTLQVWVELGTLAERHDVTRALRMYSKARDALKRRGAKVYICMYVCVYI